MSLIAEKFDEAMAAAEEGDRDYCVTLEVVGDSTRWIQLTWDSLNFAYPATVPPMELLARYGIVAPEFVNLEDWRPEQYATFSHAAEPRAELVAFIEAYIAQVLGVAPTTETLLQV
ncbi:MAG TPA: hypothetical protein VGE52_13400 [Pirellulales bacterium]